MSFPITEMVESNSIRTSTTTATFYNLNCYLLRFTISKLFYNLNMFLSYLLLNIKRNTFLIDNA